MLKMLFLALAVSTAAVAHAQKDARPNPSDPQAPVPAVQYRSVFSEYHAFRDPEIEKWRKVNDQMKELGGHKGHVAKPAAKAEAKPEAEAPADPRAGHR